MLLLCFWLLTKVISDNQESFSVRPRRYRRRGRRGGVHTARFSSSQPQEDHHAPTVTGCVVTQPNGSTTVAVVDSQ